MKTKNEAIHDMVAGLSAVPLNWVQKVAEAVDDIAPSPMWGTMWILNWHGEDLFNNARVMLGDKSELLQEYDLLEKDDDKRILIEKAVAEDDWSVLEEYIDEEQSGERCILDVDGKTTAMFIYEIDGQYVLGINGAGFDFYHGVWDKLYDVLGLQWHDTKCTHYQCNNEAVKDTDACHTHTFCECKKVVGKHYKPNCEAK